jgi:hypothetical protein
MYAFDALILNEQRTADSMIYNPQNWQLFLTGHAGSFGTGVGVPGYLENTPKILPGSMPQDFGMLTEEQLLAELGEQLSKRQIRSLLKRRNRLVKNWNEGNTQ